METTHPLPTGDKNAVKFNDDYYVWFEQGDWMLITFGSSKTRSAKSTSNAIASREKQFEFKHYHKNGSKSWSKANGYEYDFAVRKADLRLLEKETYSYPVLVLPTGEQITLNCSGGTGSKGWCDYIYNKSDSCINHPAETWQALNAIAVKTGHPFEVKDET